MLECAGLNSKAIQDAVRTLVDSSRADIVWLQETKMDDIPQRVILSALGSEFDNFVVAWRHRIGYSRVHKVDSYSVTI